MKRFLFASAVVLALTACGPSAIPAPTPVAAAGAAQQGGMDPLAAGAIGAAAGYMLGSAGSRSAPSTHSTTVVKKTVIVERPRYTPRSYTRSYSSSRSFGRR